MPIKSKVKIETLVESSRRYISNELDKVNSMGSSKTISANEAHFLPKDLHDNHKAMKVGNRAVDKKALIEGFTRQIESQAKKADKNKDGYLSLSEGRQLESSVKDNFFNYMRAAGGDLYGTESTGKVKDETKKSRIDAHVREYGASAVDYKKAFELGIAQVLKDEDGETPRAILKELSDPPLTRKQLDAQMKKLFTGMELLPVGETSESGGDPEKDWIFAVKCDVGSDHGFWVNVDRKTGDAWVNGFN